MTPNRKPDVMHQRLALRGQRHASRRAPIEAARRLARVEIETGTLADRVGKISDICAEGYKASGEPLPSWLQSPATEPVYGPPAGHPEAESLPLGAADDVMLAGWSLDLWPQDEYEQIIASAKPVLAGPVWYCPRCGQGSSAGPCGCGGSR